MNAEQTALMTPTTAPAGVNVKEYRQAANIYVLYGMTRQERREYIAKLAQQGVDELTREAIARDIFHL